MIASLEENTSVGVLSVLSIKVKVEVMATY